MPPRKCPGTRSMGRCPDCGAAVEVRIRRRQPARVLPHRCLARLCEYPGCRVTALRDRMVELDSGTWYCPGHGLLVAATTLVDLYRVEDDADWSEICDLIGHTLPDVIGKVGATERGAGPLDTTWRRP